MIEKCCYFRNGKEDRQIASNLVWCWCLLLVWNQGMPKFPHLSAHSSLSFPTLPQLFHLLQLRQVLCNILDLFHFFAHTVIHTHVSEMCMKIGWGIGLPTVFFCSVTVQISSSVSISVTFFFTKHLFCLEISSNNEHLNSNKFREKADGAAEVSKTQVKKGLWFVSAR